MSKNLPPPLRSDQYPNGLPWLTTDQQVRVDKANQLYSITCRLIRLCDHYHILWSCENPGRSFMWQTTPFQELFATMQCLSTEMHHCMFGSSRRKLTKLVHNIPAFHHLNRMCDNKHEHEPWGQKPDGSWATAEETAYPWPLARAIAAQVLLQLQELGMECHLPSFAEQEATLQAMRSATNIQPRRNLPPLVPEFKQITTPSGHCLLATTFSEAQHSQTGVCRECCQRPSDSRYSFFTRRVCAGSVKTQTPY